MTSCQGTWQTAVDEATIPDIAAAIPPALDATCDKVAKDQAVAKDILYYLNPDGSKTPWHASVVWVVSKKGEPSTLRWRALYTGDYEYVIPAGKNRFDTPMYDMKGFQTDPSQWKWSWWLAGDSDNFPYGKIYTPKK